MEKISELRFNIVITDLEEVFGKLKEEQPQTYYKHLKVFTEEILTEAIAEIIKTHEYKSFPSISKINRMAEKVVNQKYSGRKIPTYCPKCESSGMVMVETPDGQPKMYRCDCKNGDNYKKTLPPYDEEKHAQPKPLEKELDVVRFSEAERDRGLVFPGGVTIIFPCKSDGCYQEYRVDYKRRISAAEIIEAHNRASEGKAGGLCESCYYLAGKYYFLWT